MRCAVISLWPIDEFAEFAIVAVAKHHVVVISALGIEIDAAIVAVLFPVGDELPLSPEVEVTYYAWMMLPVHVGFFEDRSPEQNIAPAAICVEMISCVVLLQVLVVREDHIGRTLRACPMHSPIILIYFTLGGPYDRATMVAALDVLAGMQSHLSLRRVCCWIVAKLAFQMPTTLFDMP